MTYLAGHRLFLKQFGVHCMMVHVGTVLIRKACIGDLFDGNDCNHLGSALNLHFVQVQGILLKGLIRDLLGDTS